MGSAGVSMRVELCWGDEPPAELACGERPRRLGFFRRDPQRDVLDLAGRLDMSQEALERRMKVWGLKVVRTRSSRPNELNFGIPGEVWQPIALISETKSV